MSSSRAQSKELCNIAICKAAQQSCFAILWGWLASRMTSDKFVIAEGLLGSIVLYCTPIGDGEYAEAKDFGKRGGHLQAQDDACDGAYKKLQPVLTNWDACLTTHYLDRQSFGTIRAGGVTISKFQADEIAPALTTATRAVNALGFTPLIEKLEELCNKMLEASNAIVIDYTEAA
ncbi:hypothetical protein V2G26_004004 [Clonostachys chloroleuca]